MDGEQFREFGKAAVDYIADYLENIRERPVLPSIKPGYLKEMIPSEAPEEPESWQEYLKDIDRVIMPGMTHWHSPKFFAFYPSANSYPAIVGEMLSAGFGCIGFSWLSSPACTELEVEMMNWLGKMLDLPKEFLNSSEGPGGGVIQGTASESTLIALLAAKDMVIERMIKLDPTLDPNIIRGKLVAYSSEESNSSIEKAGLLASVPMRLLPTDEGRRLRGETVARAMAEDIEKGLIPCYVVATLGTTGSCAFDDLVEIGPVCQKYGAWLHIDAAYAGSAFVCPEYRHYMKGVEFADSFNFNPHKWMLVNFDCSAFWVKDSKQLTNAFDVQRSYLKDNQSNGIPDYRHWQIPLGRRFRALKLWAVIRIYGVNGIREYIRTHITLAKKFESLVREDTRFEVLSSCMGLVCFRLNGDNSLSKALIDKIMERKNIFLISCSSKGSTVIRFAVCSRFARQNDIEFAWEEIQSQATIVLNSNNPLMKPEAILEKLDSDKYNSINEIGKLSFEEKTK